MGRLEHRTSPRRTYFVTTKAWGNRGIFQSSEIAKIVVSRICECRTDAYLLHEFVLMPDHLHVLITPTRMTSLEKAMQLIKVGSSYQIHRMLQSKLEIWQPGFHDWTIRDAQDYGAKVRYIRMNPVVENPASSPEDWEFGSASGAYELDAPPESFTG